MAQNQAQQMIGEMKEFASFSPAAQRYIRRSLDIAFGRQGAVKRWARNAMEGESMAAQVRAYRKLESIRAAIPDDPAPTAAEPLMAPLIALTAADLAEGKLESFAAYRFLYERLIGAAVRPWLPSIFCAAAAMPGLHPALRGSLLKSIGERDAMAAGWSCREPVFFPEWVEKVPAPVALL